MNTQVQHENDNSQNVEIEEVAELDLESASPEEIREYAAKLKEVDSKRKETNRQLYARTKKAEGFEFVDGKWVKPQPVGNKETRPAIEDTSKLSQSDIIVLAKEVHAEDIGTVVEYAKFRNVPVAEALKDEILKTVLATRNESRKVADGTNTGTTKRSTGRLSDEALLGNARDGKMPESDEDIARLVKLNLGIKG